MEKQKWIKELRNTYNHAIITQMRKLVLLKQPNMMQICFYMSPIIPLLLNEIQNKTPSLSLRAIAVGLDHLFFISNSSSVFPLISPHWYFDKDQLNSCSAECPVAYIHQMCLMTRLKRGAFGRNSIWKLHIFYFHSNLGALFRPLKNSPQHSWAHTWLISGQYRIKLS